jgi:1-pyrroline-5-carboxylate dehydrogenase
MPQVITQYEDNDLPHVLEACERMHHHLTAAVVSSDIQFVNHVLANTVNGTTYAGIRARTTGESTTCCCSNAVLPGQSPIFALTPSTMTITPCSAGAPSNHWFGPAGDPRAAGIGTPEAIKLVWSTHREIVHDFGPIPHGLNLAQS